MTGAVPGSATWWADRSAGSGRARRPRADGLSLDRILDAALGIVDGEGLPALTMRRLGSELGCGHASLYRHVASHDEVVVLLVDRILGGIRLDEPGPGGPRARAERALRGYRAAILEHPALAPAFVAGQLLGPNALARREEGLRLLLDAGAPPVLAVRAYLVLTHYVIASAVFESSGAARTAVERAAMRDHFASLPPDELPTLRSLAEEINAVDPDEEFELGMRALLDHLQSQLSSAG